LPEIKPNVPTPEGRQWFINGLGMTMVAIEPGTFVMGDPGEQGAKPHRVTLTRPYFICDRQVSVGQFWQFIKDRDYPTSKKPDPEWDGPNEKFSPTSDCPVQNVNWGDALLFCNWLSHNEGLQSCYERTGKKETIGGAGEIDVWRWLAERNGYRLPTEAEWEHACRAGTVTKYAFGNHTSLLLSYGIFRAMHTSPGGSGLPNAWGLFDMHGNVLEWCWDRYGAYPDTAVTDPRGPATGVTRLLRGAPYFASAEECSSASRTQAPSPTERMSMYGFRVVCAAPKKQSTSARGSTP
jgi:formylglycine-generating enzyme required for sulfatase activity